MTDLDLVTAALPFFRPSSTITAAHRERLRGTVLAYVRERGGKVPPQAVDTPEEALEMLRSLIHRCEQLHVPWTDVVLIVNRDWPDERAHG